MPTRDYSIYYRSPLSPAGAWPEKGEWDVFISTYNESERVRHAFEKARAKVKHWLITPEYGFSKNEFPTGNAVFDSGARSEDEYLFEYINWAKIDWPNAKIAVDITGFMRPQLILLPKILKSLGVRKFDAIYSEPRMYQAKEKTTFSDGPVTEVRQIKGFEGAHGTDISHDLLILAIGYDHELISHVASSKEGAEIVEIYGLPSLRPDMYQESLIRANRSEDALGGDEAARFRHFAPANDPFATATVLAEILESVKTKKDVTNIYLSPLSTKPVALGFSLFYLDHLEGGPASMIFPIAERYKRETSVGISRAWRYEVELF